MKKLVILSLSLLMFAGIAGAKRGDAMFDELNLTDQQRTQVEALMTDHQQRMADARDQIKAETHDKLSEILNEEQMQEWQDMKAKKQERMKKRMKKMKHKKQHRREHKRMKKEDS